MPSNKNQGGQGDNQSEKQGGSRGQGGNMGQGGQNRGQGDNMGQDQGQGGSRSASECAGTAGKQRAGLR